MTHLHHVTIVIVDTLNYGEAMNAIKKTLEQVNPVKTIWFTDIDIEIKNVEICQIPRIKSKKEYSEWMIKELGKQKIDTTHILVIQSDGYVLDAKQWDNRYTDYDYIGAPWEYIDGRNVGNGGFSLRSMRLHKILATDSNIVGHHPEDNCICRSYRPYLEDKHDIQFAPEDLAHKFSFELIEPSQPTFGFHQKFWPPYKEPIVINRTGAMGDVIQTEPILEYFHSKGHPVYLKTLPDFHHLFTHHYFLIRRYEQLNKDIQHRMINLDMAYESMPQQLHLKSYFEVCGIKDYKLRNPKLSFQVTNANRMFKKYVVIHIDRRETTHRNIYGIDWLKVVTYLEEQGYFVLQIGKNEHEIVAEHFNAATPAMLMWLIGGADLFIGIDSGPAQVAVSLDIPSVILFGSVNPEYIHADLSNVKVLQSPCPIQKDNCWHSVVGTRGLDCEVDIKEPPCCIQSSDSVIQGIKEMI